MIQKTTLIAYYSILPELGDRQKQVYKTIHEHQPITNLEISQILNLPINSITPRVNELRKKGHVMDYDTIVTITRRRAIRWVTT